MCSHEMKIVVGINLFHLTNNYMTGLGEESLITFDDFNNFNGYKHFEKKDIWNSFNLLSCRVKIFTFAFLP